MSWCPTVGAPGRCLPGWDVYVMLRCLCFVMLCYRTGCDAMRCNAMAGKRGRYATVLCGLASMHEPKAVTTAKLKPNRALAILMVTCGATLHSRVCRGSWWDAPIAQIAEPRTAHSYSLLPP
jgi:hypothetical protein